MSYQVLLPLAATGLGLAGLTSLPGLFAIIDQVRERKPKDNFYEDEDGKATPESIAKFSQTAPKTAITLLSLLGFGVQVAVSVLSTSHSSQDLLFLVNWLSTGIWGLVLLQSIFLAAIHQPVKCHDLGIWILLSCAIILAATAPQAVNVAAKLHKYDDPAFILRVVSLGAAFFLGLASVLIPRRPTVFMEGKEVYPHFTISVFNRFTWTWARTLLDLATKKGDLDEKDIPHPDHEIRSEKLVEKWNAFNFQSKLLWSIVWAYKGHFAYQWSLTLSRCVLGLGPFYIMLQLIQTLEKRGADAEPTTGLWSLVVLLGLLTMLEQWIDGYVNWFSITRLSFPLRGQLSSLIFEKSLRRKNVKAAKKEEAAEGEQNGQDSDDANKKDEGKKKDDETVLKSQQAIVNLVGVDARRIASFCMMQFMIINSVGKLFLYSAFLIKLIGWIPFGAGILAWALVLPINAYASKYYMKASEVLMKTRDEKLAVVNEALLGMRQIKFAALEREWEGRIWDMREKELKQIIRVFIGDTVLFSCWVFSPILLAAVSLSSYAIIHKELTPSVAFVSIGIFKGLELALGALPEFLTMGIDTLVAVRRIDTYLQGPEMKKIITEGSDVAFDNASIAWPVDEDTPDEERFILNELNLCFPAGELSVISGKTGTGKSLVLSALLGETDLLGGSIRMPPTTSPLERNDEQAHPGNWILPGSVAYVAQTPWLESTSFRDNILFGLPLVEGRYNRVLEVCALKKDLEILPDGDKTELGANGINLSGGQKWRVTLARAIYSRAEILIMDDIFSAVDAHVGRQIFEKCIAGDLCKGRTRILVTHHVGLVQPKTKYIVELGEGTVMHCGLTSELAEDGTLQKIKSHEQTPAEIAEDEAGESSTAVNSEQASVVEAVDSGASSSKANDAVDVKASATGNGAEDSTKKDDNEARKFVEEEGREKGMVKTHVYATYLRDSGGFILWTICFIFYVAFETGDLGRNWWLRIWTGQSTRGGTASVHANGEASAFAHIFSSQSVASYSNYTTEASVFSATAQPHKLSFYLWIYITLAVSTGLIGIFRILWTFVLSLRASRSLFKKILFSVLRAPLRWLDTVPVGRILNRMTADFDIIDNRIAMDISMVFSHVLGLVSVCVAALLVTVYILPVALLLVAVAGMVGKKYMDGARPIKRLESTTKSPVFDIFNSSLAGVPTLRAYQKTNVYIDRMRSRVDTWGNVSVHLWLMNRWMGFRMAAIGTIFTTAVGIIVVASPAVDAALAGFTLSFALDFAGNVLFAIRMYANLELDMNAAERVIEYSEIKTESLEGIEPPAAWPTSGRIEVEDLVVSYADDLPPVLKNLSFNVNNNERIGVIGRTGAGKSSLTLALFRFLEPRSGKVTIDGLDISKMDLHSLRSRLAIIPQDPVLFSGTVRSNLDPFSDRSDEELRESLSRVHLMGSGTVTPANEPTSASNSTLSPKNANIFKDLYSAISESGGNLSQGQRQLLCLARAIVSRPKIMVLDEATSAVDMATDALIQRSIREEFTDSTLIVIAHRLSTIADFDRILVLSEGEVAEFGTPKELWETDGSIFRDMCESSGEKDKLKNIVLGDK